MQKGNLARCATAIALLSALSIADAGQSFKGTIGGEPREWHVVQGEGHSSVEFEDHGGYLDITIQGHASPRAVTKGAISITFMPTGGAIPDEAEVMYFPEGGMLPNFNNDGKGGELKLTRMAIEGDSILLTGRYTGTLQYVGKIGPGGRDPSRTLDVDIEFDVVGSRAQ